MWDALLETWQLSVALITAIIPLVTTCWRRISIAQHEGGRIVDIVEAGATTTTLVFTAWALHRYMQTDVPSTLCALMFSATVAAVVAMTSAVVIAALRARRERERKTRVPTQRTYS